MREQETDISGTWTWTSKVWIPNSIWQNKDLGAHPLIHLKCLAVDQKYPDCSGQRWLFSSLIQTVANIVNIANIANIAIITNVFAPPYEMITGCEEKNKSRLLLVWKFAGCCNLAQMSRSVGGTQLNNQLQSSFSSSSSSSWSPWSMIIHYHHHHHYPHHHNEGNIGWFVDQNGCPPFVSNDHLDTHQLLCDTEQLLPNVSFILHLYYMGMGLAEWWWKVIQKNVPTSIKFQCRVTSIISIVYHQRVHYIFFNVKAIVKYCASRCGIALWWSEFIHLN